MQRQPPRGALVRLLSPTRESSWTHLRVHLTVWTLLTLLWISWQFWGDGPAMRRLLMILLAVVSLTQALSTAAVMRKKRESEPPH